MSAADDTASAPGRTLDIQLRSVMEVRILLLQVVHAMLITSSLAIDNLLLLLCINYTLGAPGQMIHTKYPNVQHNPLSNTNPHSP